MVELNVVCFAIGVWILGINPSIPKHYAVEQQRMSTQGTSGDTEVEQAVHRPSSEQRYTEQETVSDGTRTHDHHGEKPLLLLLRNLRCSPFPSFNFGLG